MQDQPTPSAQKHILNTLLRFVSDIRGKIIVPYLILTFGVAVIGLYVVTRLLSSSLDERFNNHLIQSGRAVLTGFARQELDHLEAARTFSLTEGVMEAIQARDKKTLSELVLPAATTKGINVVILVDARGETELNALRREGQLELVEYDFRASDVWIIKQLLDQRSVSALRAIGEHPLDQRYYYFTAVPIALEDEFVGVVLVGTALDVLLPNLNATSMAHITVYLNQGQAIASTFTQGVISFEDQEALLTELAIPPDVYADVLESENITRIETLTVEGLDYRLSRGPLIVGNDRLAVFDVALPSDFLLDSNAVNRGTYVLVFGLAMGAVILLGYSVAQRITHPLFTLVKTSQAVAEGDLKQRTGIQRTDEIGTLATAFDLMTERLDERSLALQSSLQVQRETASRMRSILSSIGDGVLLEDAQGDIVPLNQAATAMLEDMAANFLSGPMREIPLEQDRSLDTLLNPWLLESRRFQVANRIYVAHSAAVGSDHGENLGTVIVLRDVTAEMEAEQLKDAFVAHVSHELRTPLTAIKGYTALLGATAGTALNQTQHNFLDRISRQTDNLVGMINALLDFSEVEAGGRIGLRLELLELSTLIKEIYEEWRADMDEKPLVFILEVEDNLPQINADVPRLRWALINLVRNAHQYTDAGGRVTLRLSSAQNDLVFQVIDTGVGIAEEAQKRLFTRFYRVMQSHDDNVRGLGLGLYVTKTIVEAHGGSIDVTSEGGVGSTFTVTLPAVRDQEAQQALA